jgi:hypothetical protein
VAEAAGIRELAARVRALEDAEAIRSLKARYAELVDARYADGAPRERARVERLAGEIAALFSEDAVWDGGAGLGVCRGRDAIRARMAAPTLRFSRHYFVNPRIEVDGDRAQGRWELIAPCTGADGRALWMAGVEDDAYERVGGAWLHRSMALHVVFLAPHDRGWSARKAEP